MMASVLVVGNFLSVSRHTRGVCEDLAAQLRGLGWFVLTTSSQRSRLARVIDMLVTAWCQRRRYQVAQVDVFSGLAFLWAEAVCWILRIADKPYVLTLHGGYLPRFAERWPRRVRRLLRSAAAVTTPSGYLLGQMHTYREDLHLLPNPIDLRAFRFRPRLRQSPRLIWVRAFHHLYNPMMAPRILALLTREFPEIHLTMIGPDKGDGSLQSTQELARELGVTAHIEWPGAVPREEVPVWLDQEDIFVNTTNADNTPVSVLEAMASGLCVVSTDVGGIPYLLKSGHEALLTPPNDEQAMAAAIRRLLTEPGLGEALSRNARRNVEQFDWSVVLPQWEPLLRSIAQEAQ